MNADISERIKKLRKEKGLNQEEFGKILEISRRSVSAMENGETDLSTKQIKDISKFFNVSTDYLLFGMEDNQKIEPIEKDFLKIIRTDNKIYDALAGILKSKNYFDGLAA